MTQTKQKKSTRELLQEEQKKYKWTLVLDFFELVKFISVYDWEDDYYYEYQNQEWEIYQSSCVCWFTPLKWKLTKKEYDRLEYLRDINVE